MFSTTAVVTQNRTCAVQILEQDSLVVAVVEYTDTTIFAGGILYPPRCASLAFLVGSVCSRTLLCTVHFHRHTWMVSVLGTTHNILGLLRNVEPGFCSMQRPETPHRGSSWQVRWQVPRFEEVGTLLICSIPAARACLCFWHLFPGGFLVLPQ